MIHIELVYLTENFLISLSLINSAIMKSLAVLFEFIGLHMLLKNIV